MFVLQQHVYLNAHKRKSLQLLSILLKPWWSQPFAMTAGSVVVAGSSYSLPQ